MRSTRAGGLNKGSWTSEGHKADESSWASQGTKAGGVNEGQLTSDGHQRKGRQFGASRPVSSWTIEAWGAKEGYQDQ